MAKLQELKPEAAVEHAPAAAEEVETALDPAVDRNAQLKKVFKEGWDLGVTLENAAEMGDLKLFCTVMEEPGGNLDMLVESMNATNADCNMQQKLKGCSSHIGKMMVSASNSQLAIAAYIPVVYEADIDGMDWL